MRDSDLKISKNHFYFKKYPSFTYIVVQSSQKGFNVFIEVDSMLGAWEYIAKSMVLKFVL